MNSIEGKINNKIGIGEYKFVNTISLKPNKAVYSAKDNAGKLVVIKEYTMDYLNNNFPKKLFTDISISQNINVEGFTKIYKFMKTEKGYFMIKDHYEHGSLDDILDKHKTLSEIEKFSILLQVVAIVMRLVDNKLFYRYFDFDHVFINREGKVKTGLLGLHKSHILNPIKKAVIPFQTLESIATGQSYSPHKKTFMFLIGVFYFKLFFGEDLFNKTNVDELYEDIKKKVCDEDFFDMYKLIQENEYELDHLSVIRDLIQIDELKIINKNDLIIKLSNMQKKLISLGDDEEEHIQQKQKLNLPEFFVNFIRSNLKQMKDIDSLRKRSNGYRFKIKLFYYAYYSFLRDEMMFKNEEIRKRLSENEFNTIMCDYNEMRQLIKDLFYQIREEDRRIIVIHHNFRDIKVASDAAKAFLDDLPSNHLIFEGETYIKASELEALKKTVYDHEDNMTQLLDEIVYKKADKLNLSISDIDLSSFLNESNNNSTSINYQEPLTKRKNMENKSTLSEGGNNKTKPSCLKRRNLSKCCA